MKQEMTLSKEQTKIVNTKCQDCGNQVSILCNESCQVVAVRCPDCFQTFRINAIDIDRLKGYLEEKEWTEIPIERVTVIKMRAPHPAISVFIPATKDLVDYANAMKHVINTIAGYYEKSVDDVLMEVLDEDKK